MTSHKFDAISLSEDHMNEGSRSPDEGLRRGKGKMPNLEVRRIGERGVELGPVGPPIHLMRRRHPKILSKTRSACNGLRVSKASADETGTKRSDLKRKGKGQKRHS